jgi:hypothetical protein
MFFKPSQKFDMELPNPFSYAVDDCVTGKFGSTREKMVSQLLTVISGIMISVDGIVILTVVLLTTKSTKKYQVMPFEYY